MNKDCYLIALDLDGTLLNSKKKIPFLTKRYIKKLTSQGHYIVLASGRPDRSIKNYYDQLKLTTPIISYNGAYIRYPFNKDNDKYTYMDNALVEKTLKKIEDIEEINNVIFETDKSIYITNNEVELEHSFWLDGLDVHYGTIEENLVMPHLTFIVELKNKHYDENKIKNIFKDDPIFDVRFWKYKYQGYLEIFLRKINKGVGLKTVAKEYGIEKDHIICFGDDHNDFELFKESGIKFAMKNAVAELKNKTKNITEFTNDQEGVKKALKKYFKSLKN